MAVVWGGVIAIAMRPCQRFLSRWIGEKSAALSIIAGALVLFVAASSYLTINLVTEASTVVSHFSSHKDTSPSTQTPNPTQPGLTDTQPPTLRMPTYRAQCRSLRTILIRQRHWVCRVCLRR